MKKIFVNYVEFSDIKGETMMAETEDECRDLFGNIYSAQYLEESYCVGIISDGKNGSIQVSESDDYHIIEYETTEIVLEMIDPTIEKLHKINEILKKSNIKYRTRIGINLEFVKFTING